MSPAAVGTRGRRCLCGRVYPHDARLFLDCLMPRPAPTNARPRSWLRVVDLRSYLVGALVAAWTFAGVMAAGGSGGRAVCLAAVSTVATGLIFRRRTS